MQKISFFAKIFIYDRIIHGKGDPNTILGQLAFLKDVEPNTYNTLLIKYAENCDGDVVAAIKSGMRTRQINSAELSNI